MSEVRRVKGGSFDDVKTNERSNMVFLSDAFDLLNMTEHDGEFVKIRFIGGLVGSALHWVSIQKKDGDWANIPKQCLAFDPETLDMGDQVCPYCEAAAKFRKLDIKVKVKGKLNFPVSTSVDYIYNAIVRDLQDEITPKITTKEEKESGLITKGSKSKTPVRVVRITGGFAKKLRDLKNLNVHLVPVKDKKTGETRKERVAQDLSHPKYGRDIFIKYDSKADAGNAYSVQKDDVTPLTEEETKYLRWDIEAYPFLNTPESVEEAEKNIASFAGQCWELISGKKKKKVEEVDYDDDDEDIDDDLDEDDEDDEPAPKAKAKAKRKVVDEDDEDDEPAPKAKGKKKKAVEEDEDEEDEPAPKAKGKKKSKPAVEEDDDFDLDDLDEDDEPAPKAKAKRKVVDEDDEDDEPVVKKKKKVVVEEDDEEDDEEDEPVKTKPKAKAKRKVVDEDDDDLPF